MMKRATTTYEFDVNLLLRIADPHDLILMKCATDRLKDKEDARHLRIIYKGKIDEDEIKKIKSEIRRLRLDERQKP